MPSPTYAIAADHAGFRLKAQLKAHLESRGIEVRDFGVDGTESVDYPDYAHPVAAAVASGEVAFGLLCCGTGVGMSMAANKYPSVRAVVCSDVFSAAMARAHNDANVLCLGERVVGIGLAVQILDRFVDGEFEGGRHQRRVGKIARSGEPESTS